LTDPVKYNLRIQLLLFAVCLLPVLSQAQWKDTVAYSLKQKPKLFFSLTTFNSVVSSEFVAFSGIRGGLNYNKRVKFGIGLYGLNSQVVSSIRIEGDSGYDTNAELKLGFLSLSAEYVFFNQYPWQISFVPFQIALGEGHYEYISEPDTIRTNTKKQSVVLYEPAFMGQFSIFRWIGLGASAGYRFRIYSDKELKEDLSAPTFSFGLRLFVDELYKMAFPNGICKDGDKTNK
jgi:hypothetical protein